MHSLYPFLLRPVDVKGTHTQAHTRRQTLDITVFLFLFHCWCGEDFKFLTIKDKLEMCRNVFHRLSCNTHQKGQMLKDLLHVWQQVCRDKKKLFKIQQNVSRLSDSAFQFCAAIEKFLSALDADFSTNIFRVRVSTLICFPPPHKLH